MEADQNAHPDQVPPKPKMPEHLRQYFVEWGRKGGLAGNRAKKAEGGRRAALVRFARTPRCPTCLRPLRKRDLRHFEESKITPFILQEIKKAAKSTAGRIGRPKGSKTSPVGIEVSDYLSALRAWKAKYDQLLNESQQQEQQQKEQQTNADQQQPT